MVSCRKQKAVDATAYRLSFLQSRPIIYPFPAYLFSNPGQPSIPSPPIIYPIPSNHLSYPRQSSILSLQSSIPSLPAGRPIVYPFSSNHQSFLLQPSIPSPSTVYPILSPCVCPDAPAPRPGLCPAGRRRWRRRYAGLPEGA